MSEGGGDSVVPASAVGLGTTEVSVPEGVDSEVVSEVATVVSGSGLVCPVGGSIVLVTSPGVVKSAVGPELEVVTVSLMVILLVVMGPGMVVAVVGLLMVGVDVVDDPFVVMIVVVDGRVAVGRVGIGAGAPGRSGSPGLASI